MGSVGSLGVVSVVCDSGKGKVGVLMVTQVVELGLVLGCSSEGSGDESIAATRFSLDGAISRVKRMGLTSTIAR